MNGVIVVNKPEGFTSFDVVAVLRKLSGQKKIGHCGTLDPNATGVLPVLLGKAAKAQDILPNHDKSYRADFVLGKVTDTLDIWGEMLKEEKASVTKAELSAVLQDFRGEIQQIPPMYSAVKVQGKRLYDLARQGIEVERKPRSITIYSLELQSFDEQTQSGTLSVSCSKGTYIRTLIDDIAKRFCVGGCMTSLVRTSACGYDISKSHTIDELRALAESGDLGSVLMSTESLFTSYEEIKVSAPQAKRFINGGALAVERIRHRPLSVRDGGVYRVSAPDGSFLGLGTYAQDTNELKVQKLFAEYSDF